jgi:hypothetical protein
MNQDDVFQSYRSLLFSIAYRMLGSVMDAEDCVQEAYLRWHDEQHETPGKEREQWHFNWYATCVTASMILPVFPGAVLAAVCSMSRLSKSTSPLEPFCSVSLGCGDTAKRYLLTQARAAGTRLPWEKALPLCLLLTQISEACL